MNLNMFILVSCFTLAYAVYSGYSQPETNGTLPVFLNKIDGYQDYLAKEMTAINSLVAIEDVLKFWGEPDSKEGFGNSWIILPDGNGTAKVGIIQPGNKNTTDLTMAWPFIDEFKEASEKVKFQLFTAEHPEGVDFGLHDLEFVKFPKKNGVKIICHGWRANGQSNIIQGLKNAYIAEQNVSVIGVDWSYGANSVMYNVCAKKTAYVGKTIGKLIDRLVKKFDLRYEDFHIIGHSLGAHAAGFAGRNTESKIGRITGLDPALPGFQYMELAGGRLDRADANFVDVIHSCASSLGMSVAIGHVDFYPNGGSPLQPGCVDVVSEDFPPGLYTLACSHARSYQFFEESIRKSSDFAAVRCDNWSKFKSHDCLKDFTQMGDRVNKSSAGTFYLKTKDQIPYYLGINGTIF